MKPLASRGVFAVTALLIALPTAVSAAATPSTSIGIAIQRELHGLQQARSRAIICMRNGDTPCARKEAQRIVTGTVALRTAAREAIVLSGSPAAIDTLHAQVHALTAVAVAGRALGVARGPATQRRFNLFLGRLARATVSRPSPQPAPVPAAPADEPIAPPVAPSPTTLDIAFTGMSPGFALSAPDYGIRCSGGHTSVTVSAPVGSTVSIGGQTPTSGTWSTSDIELTPGRTVNFTVADAHGSHDYRARCLPDDFPTYSSTRPGVPQAEWYITTPDLFGTTGPYAAIFDNRGAPVWWQRMASWGMDAKLLPDGTLAWWVLAREGDVAHYEIHSLDGVLLHRVEIFDGITDNHDLRSMPNGDYLVLSYVPRTHVDLSAFDGSADATVLDAEIQEVSPTGSLVWRWNSSAHITPAETGPWLPSLVAAPQVDLVHINSIELSGNSIVFSARHLNAIYSIDRTTGDVEWKLGGTPVVESLNIVGDPALGATSFGGQHDARILSDGTLTLHDNGTLRDRAPRAVRYAIDTGAGTATLREQVQDSGITSSGCCGSARRLTGGNWVMGWGMNSTSTENTPDGTRVFSLTFGGGIGTYRTIPVEPGGLSRTDLRSEMDQMPLG